MPEIKRLTVRGFKSVQMLEDFELASLNVLIGPNGAGKSNFIDLFRMFSQIVAGRLQIFVAEQDGPDALLFGGRKQTQRIEIEIEVGRNAYACSLTPAAGSLVFAREETRFFGDAGEYSRPLGEGHTESLLAEAVTAGDTFAPYVLNAISAWRVYHFHDTSLSSAMRQAQAVRDNIALKPDAGNLAAFLRHLRERYPDCYRRIVHVVRLAAPFFGDFIYRRDAGERMELEWFPATDPDTVFGPRQLSDGTLRFICFATLLLQPVDLQPDLILIDEPELGLHPYALTLLAELLQQASDARQLIISTQSADLVSELEPEQVVVVDQKDGASNFERLDSDYLQAWLADYALGDLWRMNIFGGRPGS